MVLVREKGGLTRRASTAKMELLSPMASASCRAARLIVGWAQPQRSTQHLTIYKLKDRNGEKERHKDSKKERKRDCAQQKRIGGVREREREERAVEVAKRVASIRQRGRKNRHWEKHAERR